MAILAKHNDTTFNVGDTVRVNYKIIEKEVVSGKTKKEKHEEQKERTQAFEGIVIAIRGKAENQSFVVRHMGVGGIGVERIFPIVSPWVKSVLVVKTGKVRRAKLYYLRDKKGKEASKIKESRETSQKREADKKAKATKDKAVLKPVEAPVAQDAPVNQPAQG